MSVDPFFDWFREETEVPQALHYVPRRPVAVAAEPEDVTRDLETLLLPGGAATISGATDIRFDFGVELAGWLEFECDALPEGLTVSISEYNAPAIVNLGAVHPVKTARPVRRGGRWRLELNPQLYEGVRFAWLHAPEAYCVIRNVRVVAQVWPVVYRGRWASDVEWWDRIWQVAAYTVRLNILPDGFGAILMERSDRHSWTGDAWPTQNVSMLAFGNFEHVQMNLLRTAHDDNAIKAFSLCWVLSLFDYFLYSGDYDFCRAQFSLALEKMETAFLDYAEPKRLRFMGHDERLGASFENPDLPEGQRLFRMMVLQACRAVAHMAHWLGEREAARDWRLRLVEKTRELYGKGYPFKAWGIHSVVGAVNAGVVLPQHRAALIQEHFSDANRLLSFSPFNQTFILEALARLGLHGLALEVADRCWGGQLRLGATTFWEVFRPDWERFMAPHDPPPNSQAGYTSLCHPWSSGILPWMQTHLLGLRPIRPGFEKFLLRPFLPEACTSLHATVPLHEGCIRVEIQNRAVRKIESPDPAALARQGRVRGVPRVACDWNYPCAEAEVLRERPLRCGDLGHCLFHHNGPGVHALVLPDCIEGVSLASKARPLFWSAYTGGAIEPPAALATNDSAPCDQTFYVDVFTREGCSCRMDLFFLDGDAAGRRQVVEWMAAHTLEQIAPATLVEDFSRGLWLRVVLEHSVRVRIQHVRGPNAVLNGIYFSSVYEQH